MSIRFDQTDFSVVVKNRAPPSKPWRWEIFAGRKSPVECSSVLYETVEAANRAGKRGPQAALDRVSCLTDRVGGAPIPNSSYGWMSDVSPLDALTSINMGTFWEFQLYMV